MTRTIEWTSEMASTLKDLIQDPRNLSYNAIADIMSKQFNEPFTRNSTVGKAHRMMVQARKPRAKVTAINTRPRNGIVKLQPYVPPSRPATVELPPPGKGRSFLELEHGACKWPSGSSIPYSFCGHPIAREGGAYCADHNEIAYYKPRKWE